MDIWESSKIIIFIAFVIPGFVCIKVYNLFYPSQEKDVSLTLISSVAYSCLNYAVLSGFIFYFESIELGKSSPILYSLFYAYTLLVNPILMVIIWQWMRKKEVLVKTIHHPVEKPWDYVFSKGTSYWIKVFKKDGTVIGGLYSGSSFASSSPAQEQIYIETKWILDEDNNFVRPVVNSAGVIVLSGEISHIELKHIVEEDN